MAGKKYEFSQFLDSAAGISGGWQIYGISGRNNDFRTRKGRNIVVAYNEDTSHRSREVLELMRAINRAYHKKQKAEFNALLEEADKLFTGKSYAALRVYRPFGKA